MQINPIVEATSKNTRSCEAIPVLMFFPQLKAPYVVGTADSCCYKGVISTEFNTIWYHMWLGQLIVGVTKF